MEEITIKVPRPFAGVSDLGLTARYPVRPAESPTDVPLLIEGPAAPMRRLADRLRLLADLHEGRYRWTDPILLSDNVIVMGFRDRSLEARPLDDAPQASLDYVVNLARPVTFPFLQDCARLAGLRLSQQIEMRVEAATAQVADLSFRLEQVVTPNGTEVLWGF